MGMVQVTPTLENIFEDGTLTPFSTLPSFQKLNSENSEEFSPKL